MFSFEGHRPVDLTPRLKARVYRVDGSIEEGNADPYGKPWVMKEGRFPGDNSRCMRHPKVATRHGIRNE